MKQFAFIGLGALAMNMLESIAEVTDQILVIDKNPVAIDRIKDLVKTAYVADAADVDALERILPENLDVAVVDMSGDLEASLLVTHVLKKRAVPEIIVKAKTEDKSELLEIVGATRVVFSDKEAAKRIVPLVMSSSLYNYLPIGGDMVMAEVLVPKALVGKTLLEADLRRKSGINIVALRSEQSEEYRYFDGDYRLLPDDVLLAAGKEPDILAFSGTESLHTTGERRLSGNTPAAFFSKLFKGKNAKA